MNNSALHSAVEKDQIKRQIRQMKQQLEDMYGLQNRAELMLNSLTAHIGSESAKVSNLLPEQSPPPPKYAVVNLKSTPEKLRVYANRLQEICDLKQLRSHDDAVYLASPNDSFVSTPKYHLPEDGRQMEASQLLEAKQQDIIQAQHLIDQLASESTSMSEGQLGEFKQTQKDKSVEMDMFEAEYQTHLANEQLSSLAADTPHSKQLGQSIRQMRASIYQDLQNQDVDLRPESLTVQAENPVFKPSTTQLLYGRSGSTSRYDPPEISTLSTVRQYSLKPRNQLSQAENSAIDRKRKHQGIAKPQERLSYEMKERIKAAQTSALYDSLKPGEKTHQQHLYENYSQPTEYRLSRIFTSSKMNHVSSLYGQFKPSETAAMKSTLRQKRTTKAEGALVQARALSRQNDRKYDLSLNEWNENLKQWRRQQEDDMLVYRKYK